MVENYRGRFFLPLQDPRHYQTGQGSFFRRTGYSVSPHYPPSPARTRAARSSTTQKFSARPQRPRFPPLPIIREARLSVPLRIPHMFVASERTFSNVVSTWATQMGLDTITIVVKEFWPDIQSKISKTHKANIGLNNRAFEE